MLDRPNQAAIAPRAIAAGRRTVWALNDGAFCPQPEYFHPDAARSDDADAFRPGGQMHRLPIGCFVVEEPSGQLILIDAGFGPGRLNCTSNETDDHRSYGTLEGGELPNQLAAAGLSAENITDTILTHFHSDHIGWLASQVPVLLSPDVRIWASQADHRHFEGVSQGGALLTNLSPEESALCQRQLDAVGRLRDEGRIAYREHGDVLPGIRLLPTPGHTPGHISVHVQGSGSSDGVIVLGDALTVPIQFRRPDWHSIGDIEVACADRTRAELATLITSAKLRVCGCHFPGLQWGTLGPTGWTAVTSRIPA